MKTDDLYNPQHIKGLVIKGETYILLYKNQTFQEWPGSVELWEQLPDGRLLRVRRWLKKTISHISYNGGAWEHPLRDYIKPK